MSWIALSKVREAIPREIRLTSPPNFDSRCHARPLKKPENGFGKEGDESDDNEDKDLELEDVQFC